MSALGPHAGFILGSYAAAILIIGALSAWIWSDHRARRRDLDALDGVRRSGERR